MTEQRKLITNVTDPADKEFNNRVTPPETPEFNPEKYILNESKFDLTGVKLLDDDNELEHKVADTNANPYVDKTDNNEAQISIRRHSRKVIKYTTKYGWIQLNSPKHTIFNLLV